MPAITRFHCRIEPISDNSSKLARIPPARAFNLRCPCLPSRVPLFQSTKYNSHACAAGLRENYNSTHFWSRNEIPFIVLNLLLKPSASTVLCHRLHVHAPRESFHANLHPLAKYKRTRVLNGLLQCCASTPPYKANIRPPALASTPSSCIDFLCRLCQLCP